MSIQQQITEKLTHALRPSFLQVENESFMHAVPADAETHFKVVIVSNRFGELRPVARHQLVYRELHTEMSGPVHALALHTYTENEWQAAAGQAPASPDCKGGSKPG
ncbi:MAG: BolA/IbaG family iron-sulfur metabolism protein [Pseudomonadales bacterium]|nr:BolA/IbaG family iron-sulfur metabolism protein [Gammaproteobacteria bacterium]NNL56397.1 BolA/IbaG family iron-sulfur metabolism protein [Pseudomonadales bacterium]